MTPQHEAQIAKLALATHPVATLVVDLKGTVLYANTAARRAFALPRRSDTESGTITAWQAPGGSACKLLATAALSSNWLPIVLSRDTVSLNLRARGLHFDEAGGQCVLITSVPDAAMPFREHARQIKSLNSELATTRRTAEKLEKSVAVAEALKRELVHRVKNNLAIVSALLRSQARSAGDGAISQALQEAANRIMSISTVHEVLDASKRSSHLDVEKLVSQLVTGIREAICPPNVRIETDVESALAHIDTALPLALLINELTTNAIKHAFEGRDRGVIRVTCRPKGAELEVRVADDGVGMPKDAHGEIRIPRVVAGLATQLNATLDCRQSGGTEWVLNLSLHVVDRLPADVAQA